MELNVISCKNEYQLSTMLSRTHIEEANKHLHALHNRVNSLERSLKEHQQIVARKDEKLKAHISELKAKDLELIQYKERIQTLEKQQKKFEDLLRQKNAEIDRLQKCDTAVKSVQKLVPNLKQLMLDIQEALQIDSESSGHFKHTAESEINDGLDGGDYSERSRVSEMAKYFVRDHHTKHFSISEEEEEEEEENSERKNTDLNHSDSKSQQVESVTAMVGKEFYL